MNKKGMAAETLGKFILVFLVVFILILVFNRTMKGGTKVLECTANGGQCKTGTCDFATQVPMLRDKAAGCQNGEICCININKEKPKPDPKCNGQTLGYLCDKNTNSFCDWALQCVSKCEFCAKNFGTDEVASREVQKRICDPNFNYADFSCKCTKAECDTKDAKSCISDLVSPYCPGKTPGESNYACCK
jgi:hypothetical protein